MEPRVEMSRALAKQPFLERMLKLNIDTTKFMELATHGGKNFPEKQGRQFIADHFDLGIQASILYLVLIFGIKYLMRNREPFSLFIPLNIWNFILAAFSIIATLKLTPEFFGTILNKGLTSSYCYIDDFTRGENGYWTWLFICSKLFELIDTIFIVLRKRPLMFLHWYHHILTLFYAVYAHPITPGFNRYGIYMNLFVHAFMYTYYFLRSMKIRVPGVVAKFITTIQIAQFVISVAILIHVYYLVFVLKKDCDFHMGVFYLAAFMDSTYLVLFVNFFLQSYVVRGGKAKYQAPAKEVNEVEKTEEVVNSPKKHPRAKKVD